MSDTVIDAPAPTAATPAPAPTANAAPAPAATPAPAAPAAAPAASAPAAEPPASAPAAAPAAPKWADTWRADMAGDDEKLLKRLERMASPADLAKTIREQDKLIAQGKAKSPLPKDATPEQITEWRTANGIPDAPEKYDTTLGDGLVFGEQDKPAVDAYLKAMHGVNATPEQVKAGLGAYAQFRDHEVQALAELDTAEKATLRDELAAEWGGNFSQELARIEAMFAGAPSGVRDKIMGARAGKSAVMNDPAVVRWLAGVARELNPTATIVPAGGNKEGAIADEIKNIEAMMYDEAGNNNPKYWKDAKMQERYQLLLKAAGR